MPTTPPTEPQGSGGSALIAAVISGVLSLIAILSKFIPQVWRGKNKRKKDEAQETLGLQTLYSDGIQEQMDDKNRQLAEARQECKDLRAEVEELKDKNAALRDKEIDQRAEISKQQADLAKQQAIIEDLKAEVERLKGRSFPQ